MATRLITIDHDTPMLLPMDLRDWLPANHMVHFIMDAVGVLNLSEAKVNTRGTGSAQYPPSLMLGLLIYSYATGIFSSRKIEQLTYDNVAMRYLCVNHHPDHDSICKFRRENKALLESSFHQVLECAARAKVLQVGDITLAIDGTKILANASKHSAVSYGHATEQMKLLSEEIAQLSEKAENADSTPLQDGLSIPEEITRRKERLKKIEEAKRVIEDLAKESYKQKQAEYERKQKERKEKEEASGKKPRGKTPQPPTEGPEKEAQYNYTDPESRIMKAGSGAHFEQSYNAQAGVEVESRLIVTERVSNAANDKQQLIPTLQACSSVITSIQVVLVDNGYASEAAITQAEVENEGIEVYAPAGRESHGLRIKDLEKQEEPLALGPEATYQQTMAHRMKSKEGKKRYAQRKQTIEPVFGIIKSAMGFRQFMMRGLEKVQTEWTLVTLSYNVKRLFHMGVRLKMA